MPDIKVAIRIMTDGHRDQANPVGQLLNQSTQARWDLRLVAWICLFLLLLFLHQIPVRYVCYVHSLAALGKLFFHRAAENFKRNAISWCLCK